MTTPLPSSRSARSRTALTQVAAGLWLLISLLSRPACAQGTAFTYQGRLDHGGLPANGNYDLAFSVWNAASAGVQAGETITNANVAVSNGLFTVALDFGAGGVFGGADRWLEIAVRTNNPAAAFNTLAPRQRITPTPYAITAGNLSGVLSSANLAGLYSDAVLFDNPANGFNGTFFGSGAGLTTLNASGLTLGTVPAVALSNAWKIGGNTGTTPGTHFLGTTDNQPLELKVNGIRGWRLEPGSTPNVIGGHPGNTVTPGIVGAVIAGGTSHSNQANFATISGGQSNVVSGILGAIGGGALNRATGFASTAAGGLINTAGGHYSTVSGGVVNRANGFVSSIHGGENNLIMPTADHAVIGGGLVNFIDWDSLRAVIAGGGGNAIGLNVEYGTIGGGLENIIWGEAVYATIAGGVSNTIDSNSAYSTISGGQSNDIAPFAMSGTIAGGTFNRIGTASGSGTIGGGSGNAIADWSGASTIAGGGNNTIDTNSSYSTISGGRLNDIRSAAPHSTIGGGRDNTVLANADASTVAGGIRNTAGGDNQPGFTVASTVAGGDSNFAGAPYATIGGGMLNTNTGFAATIPGGRENVAAAATSFAAGRRAKANHAGTLVWADSTDADFASTSSNQFLIRALGGVGIGTPNPLNLLAVEGLGTTDGGVVGFAEVVGRFKRTGASHSAMSIDAESGRDSILYLAENGATRWGLRHDADQDHELDIRYSFTPASFIEALKLSTNGTLITAGPVNPPSDRNVKQDFAQVNSLEVLAKVAGLPIHTWAYRNSAGTRHIGPVAQDFHAAFGLNGDDDKHIATVDADGIALAAIQGLNRKTEDRSRKAEARIEKLEMENAGLKRELAELKQFVGALADTAKRGEK